MLRALILVLILIAVAVGVFFKVERTGGNVAPDPESAGTHDVSGAQSAARQESRRTREMDAIKRSYPEEQACPHEKSDGIRIGSFERPHSVPGYEIVQRSPDERDGACGTHLLVDTRARSEDALALIARDIKARYADYDAVSIEFTDTTVTLDYNGGALIFNTPDGAYYIGFIYGPPNNKGFIARAAE